MIQCSGTKSPSTSTPTPPSSYSSRKSPKSCASSSSATCGSHETDHKTKPSLREAGPEFWQPYVEEWEHPPVVKPSDFVKRWFGGWFGLFVVKRVILPPFNFYPFVGILVSAWFKALGTGHILHRRYFEAKKMSENQIAVFIEERKWDYRSFGFAAALLEGLSIIGLVFTISNRVGAAMWAHDLEKRQHFVAAGGLTSKKD